MSRGVNGFQSGRLSQALAARRLPQVQLAAMIGVSPATVSKWRAGHQDPEPDALERLAAVINVSPEWFTRPLSAKLSLPLFRSNASAHVAARQMLEARLEWTQDISIALEEFVDFPETWRYHRLVGAGPPADLRNFTKVFRTSFPSKYW